MHGSKSNFSEQNQTSSIEKQETNPLDALSQSSITVGPDPDFPAPPSEEDLSHNGNLLDEIKKGNLGTMVSTPLSENSTQEKNSNVSKLKALWEDKSQVNIQSTKKPTRAVPPIPDQLLSKAAFRQKPLPPIQTSKSKTGDETPQAPPSKQKPSSNSMGRA